LNDFPIDSPSITFMVEKEGCTLRIDPTITTQIKPIGVGLGKYIQSNIVGSTITLRKKTLDSWFVEDIIGTWEEEV